MEQEAGWVGDTFNRIGDELYKQCCDENSKDYKIFGSLCHRGMINHVFDYHHESQMRTLRHWIDQLGPVFHPELLSTFKMSDDSSIYVNGMFCSTVRKFCIYCETMFDVSRYDVAKFFVKRSPEEFLDKGTDIVNKAYNNNHAAAIYAENGDYESALKCYQHSIEMLEDENCRYNYQCLKNTKVFLDDFIAYYKQNGTSVLSSKY
jgi:tetratricopeptide (TPR) repeat protein